MAQHPQAFLEIKSKWHRLEHLLPLGPNPQVIFAWSLNPPELIREAELGTASLEARIKAAKLAAGAGFRVAFHFDPLIFFPGWEEVYRRTVERLGGLDSAADVAWVSLGALRFLPPLRRIIFTRFPHSRLGSEEMVRAPDGKLRYFKNLRVEMYSRMREWLAEVLPGVPLYLCMESPRIWREVFDYAQGALKLGGVEGDGTGAPQIPSFVVHALPVVPVFSVLGEHLQEHQAHPLGGEMIFIQQALDGFYQIQVLHGVFPAVGVGAGRFEEFLEGFFPITQG
jgi:hypothetical protein